MDSDVVHALDRVAEVLETEYSHNTLLLLYWMITIVLVMTDDAVS